MKYAVIRVKKLVLPGIVMACILLTVILNQNFRTSINAGATNKQIPIYNVATDEAKISITFDVAWGNSDLSEIIQTLEKQSVKAAFFVTGQWVEKFPGDLKKIADLGHGVENHSDAHPHVASINAEALRSDTVACNEKIQAVLGTAPKYYRAPYGEYDNEMMDVIENQLKLKVLQWDADSLDWHTTATVNSIVNNVLKKAKSGSIILFHVDTKSKNTAPALDIILDKLLSEGYTFVLPDDLLIKDDYYVDHAGVQRKKQSNTAQ